MKRLSVFKDQKYINDIFLGPVGTVLRASNSTTIIGDKHTCEDATEPKNNDRLHLKNFGKENKTELRGHAKYKERDGIFLYKDSDKSKPGEIGKDDWEAADSRLPPTQKS
jgi:hypothetical protein